MYIHKKVLQHSPCQNYIIKKKIKEAKDLHDKHEILSAFPKK
jgi:hypothetical protein